jgi:dihydrolipoamide dehydrogenase
MIMTKNRGLIRVYGDSKSGKLLGASLFCVKGENLAHLLAWCIQQELTVFDLLRMPFYHPVIEEALQAALRDLAAKVENRPSGILDIEKL